jgi:hypothetical protein
MIGVKKRAQVFWELLNDKTCSACPKFFTDIPVLSKKDTPRL